MTTIINDLDFICGALYPLGGESYEKAMRVRKAVAILEERITSRFFEVGRMGGNTIDSVHRKEWETLSDFRLAFVDLDKPAEIRG